MRLYEPSDYPIVKEWIEMRGFPTPLPSDLPEIGFIEDFVAAGFLIQTDTSTAIIDFYVTNPEASPIKRAYALNKLTECLIQDAKSRGYKKVRCSTRVVSISKLAKFHGFKSVGTFESLFLEV